jgi:hypothetical protein
MFALYQLEQSRNRDARGSASPSAGLWRRDVKLAIASPQAWSAAWVAKGLKAPKMSERQIPACSSSAEGGHGNAA